jgi:acid stress-induced BolA-like protein IbaG/YrbA
MNPQQVAQLIEDGLGGSHAMVTSEDNVHFEAKEIHALALQVFTPDEYARQGRG